jgi:hypothetical protein
MAEYISFDDPRIFFDDARVTFDGLFETGVVPGSSNVLDLKKKHLKKGPHPISRVLHYDIYGSRLYQKTLFTFILGVLRLYELTSYTLSAKGKYSIIATYSLKGFYKHIASAVRSLVASSKYYSASSSLVQGKAKFADYITSSISGISGFARKSEAVIISTAKYLGKSTIFTAGIRKIEEVKQSAIVGKKNITNILVALGLFDRNK